jgi:serine/threonine-protein kinase RsbW
MMSIDVAIAPDIELSLPARAENVAIVRHAFGALGEALDVAPQTLSDILLAITEACTNVVVHAYPGEQEGPMQVQATLLDGRLLVAVRDEGPGIVPRPDSPGLGLGLPLIASLAESVQLGHGDQGRTEVRMTFSLRGTSAWDDDAQQASSQWSSLESEHEAGHSTSGWASTEPADPS